MEPSVRKLIKENSRPKKPLAERDLTVKMLSEALKKEDRKEMSTLASEYMGRGVGPTVAAGLLHIPRCTPTEHLYNSLPGREGGILKSYSE
ncbi:MAG: hypothetical protein M1113_05815 [Candidatus Thermoplasmatota archaeon]|nr:hypothetical protein [Candidatus Thermoplasmatota archaeon]